MSKEFLQDVGWDGKGDFDVWKKELLVTLADRLRPHYAVDGGTVGVGPAAVRVRRGRTWGFDLTLGSRKDSPKIVQLKLDYGCSFLDDITGPGIALILLGMAATAFYWIRHLYRKTSSVSMTDLELVLAWPLLVGLVIFGLWSWCTSQLAKVFGKPPEDGDYDRLIEHVRAFAEKRNVDLPPNRSPAAAPIARKHVRPRLGEALAFESTRTQVEWLQAIRDIDAKANAFMPLQLEVDGDDVFACARCVRPDPLQSAFYGRLVRHAGGVSLRGSFKLRPWGIVLMAGLAALFFAIACGFAWEHPSSFYVPILTAAGLYGAYRAAVWIDGDNREEVSSLIEIAGAP